MKYKAEMKLLHKDLREDLSVGNQGVCNVTNPNPNSSTEDKFTFWVAKLDDVFEYVVKENVLSEKRKVEKKLRDDIRRINHYGKQKYAEFGKFKSPVNDGKDATVRSLLMNVLKKLHDISIEVEQ